jgi:hypothetical protein
MLCVVGLGFTPNTVDLSFIVRHSREGGNDG